MSSLHLLSGLMLLPFPDGAPDRFLLSPAGDDAAAVADWDFVALPGGAGTLVAMF